VARIPLLDPDDPNVEPDTAAVLRAVKEGGIPVGSGSPLKNIIRGLANHMPLMGGFFEFVRVAGGPPYEGNITAKQSELAYLTSARVLECFY